MASSLRVTIALVALYGAEHATWSLTATLLQRPPDLHVVAWRSSPEYHSGAPRQLWNV